MLQLLILAILQLLTIAILQLLMGIPIAMLQLL